MNVFPIKSHRDYERHVKRTAAGVLRDARSCKPKEIFVVGVDENDQIFVMGSPNDPGNTLWLMEMAKKRLTGG